MNENVFLVLLLVFSSVNETLLIVLSLLLFFLSFPLCRGEALSFVTLLYGYFHYLFPLLAVVGIFSSFFVLLCLSSRSLF